MLILLLTIFISILLFIYILLYLSERISAKKAMPHAIVKECWGGKERRKYTRFKANLAVNYVVGKNMSAKNRAQTVDISEGGMKLLISEKLFKGAVLDLQILIPSSGRTSHIQGDVVWVEEATENDPDGRRLFYVGIEFGAVNEPHRNSIMDYIRTISAEDELQVT